MAHALPPGPLDLTPLAIDDDTNARTESPLPGPVGLDVDDAGPVVAPLDWRNLGFLSPPFAMTADGRRLYRVWGGTSLERGDPNSRGVFFSFTRPATRWQAEGLFAIAEFGNACRFVSEFEAPPGTMLFVGRVDPGDDVHPRLADAGEQVFIRNPEAQRVVRVGQAARLEDDFGGHQVYSGPPGKA
jgi:hypothetical protein